MSEVQSPPSFLDLAFIAKVLQNGGEDSPAVRSVAFGPLGAAGDNYSSCMFRATVKTEKGSKTLVIKTLPTTAFQRANVLASGVFETEALMLSELIPEMERLLADAAPGRFQPLAARCPGHGSEPEPFVVLEDLAPAGFRLADRKKGLDLHHALLALRTLARFHAASAALLARDPYLKEKMRNPWGGDSPRIPVLRMLVASGFQSVAEACRSWEGFPSEYTDIVEANKDKSFDRFIQIQDYKPGRFNVILHGDFWVNNVMFRYNQDEVLDMRLVDLQMSYASSPALDILYFLSTSLSLDVFKNKINLLLRQYHKTLTETLDLLGLNPYPWEDFRTDLDENGISVMLGMFLVLPIIKTEEVPDLGKSVNGGSQANNSMYTSSSYERHLRVFLPEFHQRGWLH